MTSDVDKTKNGAESNETRPTPEELKIIGQMEYYFGDINLGRDKFLQEQVKLDDGWVTLETMLTFNRLSKMTTDPAVIVAALEKSNSGLIEISEDKTKIRRSPGRPLEEMCEDKRKEQMERTAYCKGFPKEGVTINDLLDFFVQFGQIDRVFMRNYQDKASKEWHFKGSVFALFTKKEDADAFLKLDSVKFQDSELIRKWQKDYLQEKREERENYDKNKKKPKKQQAEDEEREIEEPEGFPTGTVLHMVTVPEKINRELIKKKIEDLGFTVGFLNYNKGDSEGWIRLEAKDAAKELIGKIEEGKLKLLDADGNETTIDLALVEGDEEEKFLKKAMADMKNRRPKGRGKKGPRGRGGFGSRKRKGGRNDNDAPPAKIKAS